MTLGLILGASTTLGDSLVTLISFLLLFVVIKSVAWKPLMNMLAQREEAINADLDKAETARLSAEQQLAEVELQLREARTKANDTLSRAQAEGTEMQRAIVEEAKEKGFVETLFHRRRYLPDITSSNFNLRSFAERTAINSPIQGSAADIIKVAMIRMEDEIEKRGLQTKMLLQVHDELIFECPEEEVAILEELVPQVMEHAVELSVPLIVDSNYGDSWYEAK